MPKCIITSMPIQGVIDDSSYIYQCIILESGVKHRITTGNYISHLEYKDGAIIYVPELDQIFIGFKNVLGTVITYNHQDNIILS